MTKLKANPDFTRVVSASLLNCRRRSLISVTLVQATEETGWYTNVPFLMARFNVMRSIVKLSLSAYFIYVSSQRYFYKFFLEETERIQTGRRSRASMITRAILPHYTIGKPKMSQVWSGWLLTRTLRNKDCGAKLVTITINSIIPSLSYDH